MSEFGKHSQNSLESGGSGCSFMQNKNNKGKSCRVKLIRKFEKHSQNSLILERRNSSRATVASPAVTKSEAYTEPDYANLENILKIW